ncbi:MAG TPA: YbaN family protein [Acidimicrobiales bacterium]
MPSATRLAGTRVARAAWFCAGWVAVGLGGIGIVVPGLPTTIFFIIAASCFARSSPRFERWVLGLPRIGPMVSDYRAGLGMSRRAKTIACASILAFGGLGVLLTVGRPVITAVIVAAIGVGVWYVLLRVPTRERVLEASARVTH